MPLQLFAEKKETAQIIWTNDYPSSVCLCRPKTLIFEKENAQLTNEVIVKMEDEINNLIPTKVGNVSISAKMCFTMVDTKVVNNHTKTNSQKCYICKRSGKLLNQKSEFPDSDNPEIYAYGMSLLHAYVRTMELCLKITYRLGLKTPSWRVSKKNEDVKQRSVQLSKRSSDFAFFHCF